MNMNETQIILLNDPKVLAISIVEDAEALFDLTDQTEISWGPSPEIPNNNDYTKVRTSIYHKLVAAQNLLPGGLKLCLYEGYRSLALQEKLFGDRFVSLNKKHPDWNRHKVFMATALMVSPVTNLDGTKNIPPHSTGGAIDVYLIDKDSNPVDMGILVEDWVTDQDGVISQTDSKKISTEAAENRNIMSTALQSVGFVNYSGEYWHWSYGDRYWAYMTNQGHAIYGTV